jgi:hypothetical protein
MEAKVTGVRPAAPPASGRAPKARIKLPRQAQLLAILALAFPAAALAAAR